MHNWGRALAGKKMGIERREVAFPGLPPSGHQRHLCCWKEKGEETEAAHLRAARLAQLSCHSLQETAPARPCRLFGHKKPFSREEENPSHLWGTSSLPRGHPHTRCSPALCCLTPCCHQESRTGHQGWVSSLPPSPGASPLHVVLQGHLAAYQVCC